MNASKDLWSVSAERNKMAMEVYQVPLKGLAQAQRQHKGSAEAGGHDASFAHGVTLLLSHHDRTVWTAFNNSNQCSLI